MLFNTLDYALFLPLVVLLYFSTPMRWRWVLLLGASYFFYMCWKVEYAALILLSTLVDYVAGLRMARTDRATVRRTWLSLSLAGNLGILVGFKYLGFLADNLREVLSFTGHALDVPVLDVLLPVGVSFYTFQSLSYTIDVYRGRREPERHFGIFALYVSFFPQLVAGPIERSDRLLPQFREHHVFDEARIVSGLKLILWGLFLKTVIADRAAQYVDPIYGDPSGFAGIPIWLATYAFAFQIYCDFAGYSAIAIGSARLMGYHLMKNFDRPYAAASIPEFWRRWHISLSTWFRDYVYHPLGGQRTTKRRWMRNVAIVFLVSGLWHGASWNFVVWGALHAFFFLVTAPMAASWSRVRERFGWRASGAAQRVLAQVLTFHLVCFAWIFFRAATIEDAFLLIERACWIDPLNPAINAVMGWIELAILVSSIALMEIVQWIRAHRPSGSLLADMPRWVRWPSYYAVVFSVILFGVFEEMQFLYFQF